MRSRRLAPDHRAGFAAGRADVLTAFEATHAGQLARPLTGLVQAGEAEFLGDAFVADRLGCEPLISASTRSVTSKAPSLPHLGKSASFRIARLNTLFPQVPCQHKPRVHPLLLRCRDRLPAPRAHDLGRAATPRNHRGELISPPALPAPRGRFASNQSAPPVLRLTLRPEGSRGRLEPSLWSAHRPEAVRAT